MKLFRILFVALFALFASAPGCIQSVPQTPKAYLAGPAGCVGADNLNHCGPNGKSAFVRVKSKPIGNSDTRSFGASSGGDRPATIIPAWTVPAWFKDKQNSTTCANDNNNCTQGTCGAAGSFQGPCVTWAEIEDRLGTIAPQLQQITTVTSLSADTDSSDGIIFKPVMNNGQYTEFTTVPTVLSTGTIAGVVPLNRATPQMWQVTLTGTGTTCGGQCLFVDNTTGYVSWMSGTGTTNVYNLISLLSPATTTAIGQPMGTSAVMGTPTNGDAFTVYNPFTAVNFVDLEPTLASNNAGNTAGAGLVVYRSQVWNGTHLSAVTFGQGTLFTESYTSFAGGGRQFNNTNQAGGWVANQSSFRGFTQWVYNSVLFGPVWVEGLKGFPIIQGDAGGTFLMSGGMIASGGTDGVRLNNVNLQQDVWLENATHGAFVTDNALLAGVQIQTGNSIYCFGPCATDFDNSAFINGTIWGTGVFATGGNGYLRLRADTLAVNTLLLTGGIKLFDSSTGCSFSGAATNVESCGISLTPANIDLANTGPSTGFGGFAFYPGKGWIGKETP